MNEQLVFVNKVSKQMGYSTKENSYHYKIKKLMHSSTHKLPKVKRNKIAKKYNSVSSNSEYLRV
jgi:transcriptional regulator CtsR